MAQNKIRIVLGSNGFWKLHVGVEETARTATDDLPAGIYNLRITGQWEVGDQAYKFRIKVE